MSSFLGRIRPLSIRVQLMLWFILAVAVLILLFGTVFYVNLRTSLETSFDNSLAQRTQQIAAGINEEKGTITIHDVTGALPGLIDPDATTSIGGTPTPATLNTKKTLADVNLGTLVRILNARGKIIYVSPAFLALHIPSTSVTRPLHGSIWQGTVSAQNGQTVSLYSFPLLDNGIVYCVVQVGESLSPLSNTMRSVVIELLLIAPFVLLLGAIGSYWLSARAFAPIKRLTRTARRIEVGDLHERVPVPHSKDEVHSLALTFNEMIERLDKAFTRQRRFVADASHELRTPVAAIRSMTDVALAQNKPVDSEEYLTILRDVNVQAEQLSHLISDLLELARTDENHLLLEREPVRLDLLTADVAATIETLAAEHGITVEVVTHGPVTVLGDEVRLIQVLMNLIDNAIAYTNAGDKVVLEVGIQNQKACLSIRDTGIGIAAEHLEHIFERFYRVDPARSRAVGGTGLGLAIVEWIIHAHDGNISVESQVGKGTTFTVTLPVATQVSS
jgi:two-component system, OmpR family, sensor kinase